MNRQNRSSNKKAIIIVSSLVILFFVSFTSSALIYINSKNLVFADDVKDVEKLTAQLEEKEETISDLEEQLARYKKLYETALKDASFTPAPSKTPTTTPKPTMKPTKTPDFDKDEDIEETTKPSATSTPTPSQKPSDTSTPTSSSKPTPPPFVGD